MRHAAGVLVAFACSSAAFASEPGQPLDCSDWVAGSQKYVCTPWVRPCPSGGCGAGNMRCDGNRAQICSANGDWEQWQDCSVVGESCGYGPCACSGYDGSCCR